VLKETQVPKVLPVHRDQPAHRVHRATPEAKGRKVHKVQMVLRDHKGYKAQQEYRVRKAT
jgi:hypothetical protein